MIFDYPPWPAERRHGPAGYTSVESFRPWLRDEFAFRCVYCLKREVWGQMAGEFEMDHFEPHSLAPHLTLDYLNLVYACRRCNLRKLNQRIEVPLPTLLLEFAKVEPDGWIVSDRTETRSLIRQLDLNCPMLQRWRVMWMRIVDLAWERDLILYRELTGFPDNLPDLSLLRPPINTKPKGIEDSWHAKRVQGRLPDEY